MQHKKKSIIEQDLVLIHVEGKPGFFGRVEKIIPDIKKGWWRVNLLILQLPLQVITWIIDDNQIRGEEFTMNGIPIRIEKVVAPASPPDDSKPGEKEKTPDKGAPEKQEPKGAGKKARILSLGKKE